MGSDGRTVRSGSNPSTLRRCRRPRASAAPALLLIIAGAFACSDLVEPEAGSVGGLVAESVIPNLPTVCSATTTVDLVADESVTVGTVEMSNDGERLYVVYREQEVALPADLVAPGHPTWSPDGTKLAFQAIYDFDPEQDFDIYVIDLTTGETVQLTDNAVDDESPDWSSAGSAIVFSRAGSGLHTIAPNGTNDVAFLTGVGEVAHPDWSPDGMQIAFSAARTSGSSIEVVSVSNPTTVTTLEIDGRLNFKPAWSSDGLFIAFSKSEAFDNQTFMLSVVPADGSSNSMILEGGEDGVNDLDVDWK